MVTIRDVAREAGVSVTTVSRALNNYDDVSATTRARIRSVADRLDYHPNAVARSLQRSSANAIGLIIPLALHRAHDPFWFDFIGGMAATCAERGRDLLVCAADERDGSDRNFQRLLRGRRVDGLLICDVRRSDPRIGSLVKHHLPFVAFGRTLGEHDFSYIDVDGEAGGFQGVEHLLQLGHRRIAYLGVSPDFAFSYFRLNGYKKALTRAGLPPAASLIREDLTESSVRAALRELLALPDPPTALFAAADFLALAALRIARELGLRVPQDLSIAAFDDSPVVQHAEPPLTAIGQPNRRLGEEAAQLLLDRVANPGGPLVQRLIVPTLTVRGSTAPRPRPIRERVDTATA